MSETRSGAQSKLETLEPLIHRLTLYVDDGIASGLLKQIPQGFVQRRVLGHKSTDTGLTAAGSSTTLSSRPTWARAQAQVAFEAQSWSEYILADSTLRVNIAGHRSVTQWFTLSITRALLEDRTRPCSGAGKLLAQVEALASGEALRIKSLVEFKGILVASQDLQLKTPISQITLRRPKLIDFEGEEEEISSRVIKRVPEINSVSAFAELETEAKSQEVTLEVVERLESLLRLFVVSSVKYARIHEEVISPLFEDLGTYTTMTDVRWNELATIRPEDGRRLQSIAATIWMKLPTDTFNREVEPSPVATAFRRYSDALLRDGYLLERRFASAVMGLESLYLPPKQDGELSYRLRTYVARVMEEFSFDGRIVESELAFCYGIRSAYVHGGHLSGKLRKKCEKDFGDMQSLFRRLLDYLRLSIVLWLMLDLVKEDFLPVINDSLVSVKGSEALADILRPILPTVRP